jgi:4-hydroxybenzoate polyprenyltransferase
MTATARDYLELIRPEHWIKNIIVFAGPAAGLAFTSAQAVPNVLLTFVVFCLAASAGYAFNDIVDRLADAIHPIKRNRPVASGRVSVAAAAATASLLAGGAILVSAVWLPRGVTTVLIVYLAMVSVYTLSLKRRVILDVIVIAVGFVLRAFAGALAAGVPTSDWLIACVFTLCLFMGFGKRRCEIAMMGNSEDLGEYRRTLVRYTPDLLNHLITVSAGIAIITFLLYTLDDTHPSPLPKAQLFFTLPLVVYGVFRFAMISELGRHAGPTEIVLKDRALLWTVILWTACAVIVAYQNTLFGPGGLKGLLGG